VARRQEQLSVGQMTWNTIDASGSPELTLAAARSLFLRE
jgi:hypothetical protein